MEAKMSSSLVWIYAWNENECYGITSNSSLPITIAFDASSYNHVVVVVKQLPLFQKALNDNKDLVEHWEEGGEGRIVTKKMTSLSDLMDGRGTIFYLYSKYRCQDLEQRLRHNRTRWGIAVVSKYRNSSYQCFFDYERRKNIHFQSRGLFRWNGKTLEFINDSFPSTFAIRVFSLDTNNNEATLWETTIRDNNLTEEEEDIRVVTTTADIVAALGKRGPLYLIGYGDHFQVLFKRMAFEGLLPLKEEEVLRSCCRMTESPGHRLLLPPWIHFLDAKFFFERYFPHYFHADPYVCAENLSISQPQQPHVLKLIAQMLIKVDGIRLASTLGGLADADPEFCLRKSRTTVTRRLLENWGRSVLAAPIDDDDDYDDDDDEPYRGGKVLTPRTGIHHQQDAWEIVSWDFKSFYPSLIHGLNLQKGLVVKLENEVDSDRFHVLEIEEGKYYVSVKEAEAAPWAKLCGHFIKFREREKNKVLNKAIKLTLNYIYGLSKGIVPGMITAYGRECLNVALQSVPSEGTILYGDTDSLFVRLPRHYNLSYEFDCRKKQRWGETSLPLVRLRRENVFNTLILCEKKKYVGITTAGTIIWKGLLPKRFIKRDSVNDLLKKLLLQNHSNPSIIHDWFEARVNEEKRRGSLSPLTTRIKASHKYQHRHTLHYQLSLQYERVHGPIPTTVSVSYYTPVISLVPSSASRKYGCLIECFDDDDDRYDYSERVSTYLGPGRLNTLLRTLGYEENYLARICRPYYLRNERLKLYDRYQKRGFQIYDLSVLPSPGSIFVHSINIPDIWIDKSQKKKIIVEMHDEFTVLERTYENWKHLYLSFPSPIRSHIRLQSDMKIDMNNFTEVSGLCRWIYSAAAPPPPPSSSWLILLPDISIKHDEEVTFFTYE